MKATPFETLDSKLQAAVLKYAEALGDIGIAHTAIEVTVLHTPGEVLITNISVTTRLDEAMIIRLGDR